MDISFSTLKTCEIINEYDGKRLGRIIDIVFDDEAGYVLGLVVPGIKKGIFRKSEDIFIPLSNIIKMGRDVILVKLEPNANTKPLFSANKNSEDVYNYFVYPEKGKRI